MDPAALAGLCLLLARGETAEPLPPGVACPPTPALARALAPPLDGAQIAVQLQAPGARDGIARVAFAEAGNQGDSGLAAVVYTILNRLADGRWGATVDGVLNAPAQFEPVMRAGGDWRALPGVSAAGQARIDTILNLAVEGRLPDLTNGARFFQNPAIVAARARAGTVSQGLVNFGGQSPSAVIGAHSFYTGSAGRGTRTVSPRAAASGTLFVGPGTPPSAPSAGTPAPVSAPLAGPAGGDPAQALFVSHDGQVRAANP